MTAAWVLYSVAVAVLFTLAALLLEQTLRMWRKPARGYWLVAMGASVGVPLLQLVPRGTASLPGILPSVSLTLSPIAVDNAAPVAGFWQSILLMDAGAVVLVAWGASAAALAFYIAFSALALRRQRRTWRSIDLDGVQILVSSETGPALLGFIAPRVVVPEWLLGMPPAQRRLALAHELEHVRTRDPMLLAGAGVLLLAAAWNPVVWWQVRRLRAALELDCDQRVSRQNDARAYGELLVEVGRRAAQSRFSLATGLSERASLLERRIRDLTRGRVRLQRSRTALLSGLAAALALLACIAPLPTDAGDASIPAAAAPRVVAPEEPSFTPYTLAPSLTNRDEIVGRMNSEYPPLVRNAGIGGTALVWVHVGESGNVIGSRIKQTSGHVALDAAAVRIANAMKFSPAMNGTQRVAVWIALPLVFEPQTRVAVAPGKSSSSNTVPPRLLNWSELLTLLQSEYPPAMRAAGPAARVEAWLRIDEKGAVRQVEIRDGSDPRLNRAFGTVALRMKFAPALKDQQPVETWLGFHFTPPRQQ